MSQLLPKRPPLQPERLLLRVMLALLLLMAVLWVLKEPEQVLPPLPAVSSTETLIQGPAAVADHPLPPYPVQPDEANAPDTTAAAPETVPQADQTMPPDPLLEAVSRRFTGDLKALRKRGFIRVLVSYNRTNFFLTGANDEHVGVKAKGFEHDFMEQYKKYLNRKLSRRQPQLQMVYVPVAFDRLLAALNQGEGDVVAAGMTITKERTDRVAFTKPYLTGVNEVLVTHGDVKGIDTLEDLAGQRVQVLRGSSYARHLNALSKHFVSEGLPPINITEVAASLQTEDMLELVNAGSLNITVADEHLARLWAGVLPNIKVRADLTINRDGELAWAVRKDNPKLLASMNRFVKANRKGTLMGNILFQRFYDDKRWIANATSKAERRKLKKLARLFKKYAKKYDFDWLLLAAQAFQESGLVHRSRSHRGAVGIMQIKPATARDKHVAIRNIHKLEPNIHAGVKYLAFLRDRYFSGPEIRGEDRVFFALAAYNAGPGKVRMMRAKAKRMGLNPNRWFGQVELAAMRMVGRETVTYVRNILKYSIAYKLSYAAEQQRDQDRKKMAGR